MVYTTERAFYESESEDELYGPEGDMDQALTKADLESIYDKAEPISGDVAAKLCESNCNPEALRIVYDECADEFYIDYNELATYCESAGLDPFLAAGEIIDTYGDNFPSISMENFNVVFPNKDAIMEILESGNMLGYQDVAWSSHFLNDCVNKGLKVSGFSDPGLQKPGNYADNEVFCAMKEAVEDINCEIETVMEAYIKGAKKNVNSEKISLKLQQAFKKACAAIKKEKYDGTKDIEKRIRKVDRAIKRIDIEIAEYDDKSKAGKAIRTIVKFTIAVLNAIGFVATSYTVGQLVGANYLYNKNKYGKQLSDADSKLKRAKVHVKAGASGAATGAATGAFIVGGTANVTEVFLDALMYKNLLNGYKAQLNDVKKYLESELEKAKNSAE